jgi:signal transduction histidine kinase
MRYVVIILVYITTSLHLWADHNVAPITLSKGMAEVSAIKNVEIYYDRWYKESIHSIWPKTSKNKFSNFESINIPSKFLRGQYTNWIHFQVENPYPDTFYLVMNSSILLDSIYLFDSTTLAYTTMNVFPLEKDKLNRLPFKIFNTCILAILPQKKIDVIIKNHDSNYGFGRNIPTLFDLNCYESHYWKQRTFPIFIQTGAFFTTLTLTILLGLFGIYTRDKATLYFVIYSFSYTILNFRNLEEINPYFISTINSFPFFTFRLFISVIIFLTYSKFIQVFLNNDPPLIGKVFKGIFIFSILSIFVELLIFWFTSHELGFYLRYLNYYLFRIVVTMTGLLMIPLLWKSKANRASLILIGLLVVIFIEVTGWFWEPTSSAFATLLGMIIQSILFSFALAARLYDVNATNTQLIIKNQQLSLDKLNAIHDIQNKISKDLHDDIGIGLTSLKHLAITAQTSTAVEKNTILSRMSDYVDDITENLMQSIWTLNSEKDKLNEFALDIRKYIAQFCDDHNLILKFNNFIPFDKIDVVIEGTTRRNLFLCIKELLNNTVKHSDAKTIEWTFAYKDELFSIKYTNDGKEKDSPSNYFGGNGTKNIPKRVKNEGGTFIVGSQQPYSVVIEIPLKV